MLWTGLLLSLLGGYLLGSIPVGYLVGKLHGVDVRRVGSGRTGGTNVLRAVGLIPSAITILGDALKGLAAVGLARLWFGTELSAVVAGAAVVIGHNWSIFLGFKGGAGGITAASALAALNPLCGAIVALLGIAGFVVWRMASVATLIVALLAPVSLLLFALLLDGPMVHVGYGLVVAGVIVVALLPNIARLKAGTERTVDLKNHAPAHHQ
jgi:acyl phosphate:glycerol-3-phosphate acyltransferase